MTEGGTKKRYSAGMRASTQDQLHGLLATREFWTAQALAAELGVSLRTVRRGVQSLRDQGLVLEAQSGRGGGMRLVGPAGARTVQLQHGEVLDLLLALAIAQSLQSPLLLQNLRSLRHKLGAAFAPAQRRLVERLRRRILVGAGASTDVQRTWVAAHARTVEALQDAFLNQKLLQFRYRDAQGTSSQRAVEPQYLLLNAPFGTFLLGICSASHRALSGLTA